MQGWRKRQEDAHLAAVSKGEKKDIDVFGVFDGHGGKEISKFVSNHFLEELVVVDGPAVVMACIAHSNLLSRNCELLVLKQRVG